MCVAVALSLAVRAPHASQQGSTENQPPQVVVSKSKRTRARVSKPADFAGAGLLQFEYGYDGNFRAPDTSRDQAGTASLLFNATEDLQFEVDFDSFHAQTHSASQTVAGIGDAYLGAHVTAVPETRRGPSIGFAYLPKVPAASASRGLGTGRVDHKCRLLLSKRVHTTDVDFNASLLVNGRADSSGWDKGYQLSLGLARELGHGFALQGDLFGETLDTDQPRGMFVQGGLAYQPTNRLSFDLGVRTGLNPGAPRIGLSAGISLDLANLYRR